MKLFNVLFIVILMGTMSCSNNTDNSESSDDNVNEDHHSSILIFTKTAGYRHESIEKGVEVISQIAENNNFSPFHTEDAAIFETDSLGDFKTIIFLSTTGDILNDSQQDKFQKFINKGGGFLGIHAAADTEYDWEWYGKLVGGYFTSHPNDPNVREAVVRKAMEHKLVDSIPAEWTRYDEWYNYKDINPDISVLQNLDESTYEGGEMGNEHPITWFHEYQGGRVFYTGMGHTSETFDEPLFRALIEKAIRWTASAGKNESIKE